MGFYEHYFGVASNGVDEAAVCCPFPHHTSNGVEYREHNPSAHVNLTTRKFHCKVCRTGYTEQTFITKVLGCTYANAARLVKVFDNHEDVAEWDRSVQLKQECIALGASLGISEEVMRELKVASGIADNSMRFPVFYMGKLIDVRTYNPGSTPKMLSRRAAISGAIVPYDVWRDNKKTTLICAGEKDMATTRSHGFNAVTITGGEMCLPFSISEFKDRNVVILYDNDDAGRLGANRLATHLLGNCNSVKVCNKFHEVCSIDKEDMTDFWNKYKGTREQLIAMMDATPYFTPEDVVAAQDTPILTLAAATDPKYIGKIVRSNLQVVAVSEASYTVPTVALAEKLRAVESGDNTMEVGEVREWNLTEHTVQDILHLVDNGFKETDIENNVRALLHIMAKEKYVKVSYPAREIVYKGYVADLLESTGDETIPMEYTCYSVGARLESGKKYMCTYKLIPHPYKGQQLIMLILNAVPANDSVSSFKTTEENKALLQQFRDIKGTVPERMNLLVQKVKGILGYNGNDTLIELIDLSYHTVLSFNFGRFKDVRGYLDTLIVGESRVGKSSTADALRKTYELGTFTSLAGNSATVPGLVGGSNKINGSMQTKAGLIPQNHKGLIIFEEFGKCNTGLVTELTDIRSSNEVRITRVSGTLTLPAMVRMIALSNVKMSNNDIRSIASYPNGIAVITELVPTAEDIARYDLLCVLGDRGTTTVDPYWEPAEPMEQAAYKARVRWVWSRTADQINISEEVGRHILDCANALNYKYDCHIKIFGTEAWKKLTRLAIAVAGYLVSTDDTYQQIIVTKEHVEYAVDIMIKIYDNPVFRLKEYVDNERKYNTIDEDGVELLKQLYIKNGAMLTMLEREAKPTRNTLMAAVGLDATEYNVYMASLVRGSFVKLSGTDVCPTERFRLGMAQIDKTHCSLTRLGDEHA